MNVWNDYMEGNINKENGLDNNVEGNAVENPVDCVDSE